MRNLGGNLALELGYLDTGLNGDTTPVKSTVAMPSTAAWTHDAIVKSGTTVTFYVNGVQLGAPVATHTIALVSPVCSQFFLNGTASGITSCNARQDASTSTGNKNAFAGSSIDDLHVFKRALSAADVVTIYNTQGCP